MRPEHLPTFPRTLHPGAWWLWAIGLAAAASRTQNPVPLLMIMAVTGFVVAARRGDAPWARSYVAFLKLSLVVIAMRILFQSLLSTGAQGPTVLFTLPSLPLPEDSGLKLGGVVSLEAVLRAFYEGLQLATILCCFGAANALGSARRLLRSVPSALYEIGVACVIALTFAPQLVSDAARIRAAHRLRGHSGGLGSLKRLALPLDHHPRDLSEGQRLTLALSVVIAARPPLLLLDEPTRGLDYTAKHRLVEILRDLAGAGHAVLLATHDVELVAEVADRGLVIADGAQVADGPTAEVVVSSPAFAPQVAKVLAPQQWLTPTEVAVALSSTEQVAP